MIRIHYEDTFSISLLAVFGHFPFPTFTLFSLRYVPRGSRKVFHADSAPLTPAHTLDYVLTLQL